MSLFLKISVEGLKSLIFNLLQNVHESEKVHNCVCTTLLCYNVNRLLKV